MMVLRYSATHRQEHNKIYRLDALDAYNQKLVKKIAVRGDLGERLGRHKRLSVSQSIEISTSKPPEARVEIEIRQIRTESSGTCVEWARTINLYDLSEGLDQYKGFVVSDINAIDNTLSFTNGVVLQAGDATGDVTETAFAGFRSARPSGPISKKSKNSSRKG